MVAISPGSTGSSRTALTDQFMAALAQHQVSADAFPTLAAQAFDLAAASFQDRCLTRPAFLGHSEWTALARQLDHLISALESLPDRAFGGDVAAFARELGCSPRQVDAVALAPRGRLTRLGRADLYHDGGWFRLLELNLGSPVGSLDTALLNRALENHPVLAEFVANHRLSYIDTLAEVVDTIRTECGVPPGTRPRVVATDLPEVVARYEKQLRLSAEALAPLGLDVEVAALDQFRTGGGRVTLDGRPVDIIYRVFLLNDLDQPGGADLIEPILHAAAAGEVQLFTSVSAELYGNKATLALLSDEAQRASYPADQLASLDQLLPWTRRVREGSVTVAGSQLDLREYAIAQQQELVLKPADGYGGHGVVLGWQIDPTGWRAEIDRAFAADLPYVLQQRITPLPELFPGADGPERWLLKWGVFSVARGYGGASVAGSRQLGGDVVNVDRGATAGCCFHQLAPAGG